MYIWFLEFIWYERKVIGKMGKNIWLMISYNNGVLERFFVMVVFKLLVGILDIKVDFRIGLFRRDVSVLI